MAEALKAPCPLEADHETADFDSRHEALNAWLKARALGAEGRTARTYVVCRGATVVGYYCLATGSVVREAAPGRLRRNAPSPLPVLVIGRLAVDRRHEGSGIGGGMMRDALSRAMAASVSVGCRAVLVHAIDEDAAGFYRRFGFAAFPAGSLTLFLPMETIRAALA